MMLPTRFDSATWNQFLEQEALDKNLTRSETRVFLTRFEHHNWLERIEDIWHFSDVNSFESFNRHSSNIYRKFRADCPELGMGAGNFIILRDRLLASFSGTKALAIEDNPQICVTSAAECEHGIAQPGALIRIKAPSKMGKTSLLDRIIAYAEQLGYSTVKINLLQVESDRFNSLTGFLRWFCLYLGDSLALKLDLDRYWSSDRGCVQSCTRYLAAILQELSQPLVIALDEADRLLKYPDVSQDFFYLIRSWHEEANNDELWENLRPIVVYSTEDFGSLDINRSPFNVGLPIELQPFTPEQIAELGHKYNISLSDRQIEELDIMLGGHPYLIDLTLASLAGSSNPDLKTLLQQGTTDTGIYRTYLRQHLINLTANDKLARAFAEVIQSDRPIQIDTLVAYQLYRMGLIKWSDGGNTVMPSCQLYQLYFAPRLSF